MTAENDQFRCQVNILVFSKLISRTLATVGSWHLHAIIHVKLISSINYMKHVYRYTWQAGEGIVIGDKIENERKHLQQ